MPKESNKKGKTIRKEMEDWEQENLNKNGEKVIRKFNIHAIFFIKNIIITFIVIGLFLYILFQIKESIYSDFFFWSVFFLIIFTVSIISFLYCHWKIDTFLITNEKIILISPEGALGHRIESMPFNYIKFVEIKKKGIFQTLLDFGDIHLTSITTEDAQKQGMEIVLKNIADAKEAFFIIQKKTNL